MFYEFVKKQWLKGKVTVGLSSDQKNTNVYLESSGVTAIALMFLNREEKSQLRDLSIADAKKVASTPCYENDVILCSSSGYGPNPCVVDAVVQICREHYAPFGLERLYLIGSRAKGTARESSDHDFVLVLADSAPDEVVRDNGSYGHLGLSTIRKAVAHVNMGCKEPDIVICRLTNFLERIENSEEPGFKFPYQAEHEGIRLI